jgi:hypothetical protein
MVLIPPVDEVLQSKVYPVLIKHADIIFYFIIFLFILFGCIPQSSYLCIKKGGY